MVNEIFKKSDFAQPFLSETELHTVNNFKALKKQVEWICGRYLLKQMIAYFFLKDTPLDQITLSYLDEGAPYVTNQPHIPVSLSHSNDYTAIACSFNTTHPIGLDIEKIASMPDHHFLNTAFTQNELLHLDKNAPSVFKNWTRKEAFLKYIKKGFNESLHKVEVIHDEIFHHHVKANVDIFSQTIESAYILSLVTGRPSPAGSNT
ncbi:MAG: 4'-phosphopantetheinyl transferase superfamily protein [Desulfobacula sp.]